MSFSGQMMKRSLLIGAALALAGCVSQQPTQVAKPVVQPSAGFVRMDGRSPSDPKVLAKFEADKAICLGEAMGRPASYMSGIQWDTLGNLGNTFNDGYEQGQRGALMEQELRERQAAERERTTAKVVRFNACMAERGYIQKHS